MANLVSDVRCSRGMTQQALSFATGLHTSVISRIESGSGCEVRTAQKLAAALKCSMDDLFPPTIQDAA